MQDVIRNITGTMEGLARRIRKLEVAPVISDLGDLRNVDTDGVLDNDVLTYDSADGLWKPAVGGGAPSSVPIMTIFTVQGALSAILNPLRIYNNYEVSRTVSKVFINVNTAPTGSAIIVDVHKNGTTIFTTQSNRPQIVAGAYTGYTTTIEVPSWADGEYLQMEIDQIGSTIAGSDLTVHIIHS